MISVRRRIVRCQPFAPTRGAVFKRILPKDFSAEDFRYAQEHLRITSFLYGLLRPLDGIKPYRLEGDVRLPEKGGISMFDYWKPLLTDYFIEEIKNCGGVLINLASAEMKDLFDWKRVEQEVTCYYARVSSLEGRTAEDCRYLCQDVSRRDDAFYCQEPSGVS